MTTSIAPPAAPYETPWRHRLEVEVLATSDQSSSLAADVRRGLGSRPYRLPPEHFYDATGAALFDAICDTPEYYLTRAEADLLAHVAHDVVATAQASDLVELGSGAARKTGFLLDALTAREPSPRYVPIDLTESMVRLSGQRMLARYPTLRVHGIVGDFARDLSHAPSDRKRLAAFLGSTIGNFEPDAAVAFLRTIGTSLAAGDHLLLGCDLVKDARQLDAAYNDSQGLTAAFNRNILAVINRQLDATFVLDRFAHEAFFDPVRSRIEMHLRARVAHTVEIARLGMRVPFDAGEGIHTEISRKFTRESATAMVTAAGFTVRRFDVSRGGEFALVLARRDR